MNPEPVWFRMPPPATIIPLRPVAAPSADGGPDY